MTHSFRPAAREKVSLIIGGAGPTGSGKTYSLLLLAIGLAYPEAADAAQLQEIVQREGRNRVVFIDTERGRALHYAPPPGEKPDPWRAGGGWFPFDHANLEPPFTPARYQELIEAADLAEYRVIIVDQFSHEWAGEGGILEWQEKDMTEAAEKRARRYNREVSYQDLEAVKMSSWIAPKMAHKRLVGRLTALRAHLLIGLRAEAKVRMTTETDDRGKKKTVVVAATDLPPAERWQPVCEKALPYELTLSFVLQPTAPGVPVPVKLQDQHRPYFPLDRPLSIEAGRALASWANGGGFSSAPTERPRQTPREWLDAYKAALDECRDLEELADVQARGERSIAALKSREPALHAEALEANSAAYARLSEPVA